MITQKHIKAFVQYEYVIIPWDTRGVIPLIETFASLCDAPEFIRKPWLKDESLGHDLGLTDYRLDVERGKDNNKCYLHTNRQLGSFLEMRGVDTTYHHVLLQRADEMFRDLESLYNTFMESLAAEVSISIASEAKRDPVYRDVLRILHYDDLTETDISGQKHTDKSAVTIHVASSGPVRLWDQLGKSIEYVPRPDQVLIFASDKLQYATGGRLIAGAAEDDVRHKAITGGRIHAVPHEPLFGDSQWSHLGIDGRFAVVYFGHF